MMKRIGTWLVLAVTVFLSGCASQYVSVTEGPVADVTFAVKDIEKSGLLLSTTLTYQLSSCDEKTGGSIKLNAKQKQKTVTVRADEPLDITASYFQNRGAGGSTSGRMYLLFLPRQGKSYLVEYERIGNIFKVGVWNRNANGERTTRARTVYGLKRVVQARTVVCKKLGK